MASHFFDTSALVKRYIQETGSAWVSDICDDPAMGPIFIGEITEIELVSAVYRRGRGGSLTNSETQTAISDFGADRAGQYSSIEVSRNILIGARNLVEIYALRGSDAVQLALAVECNDEQIRIQMPSVIFVSADNEINDAAKSEGLTVENPNNYP